MIDKLAAALAKVMADPDTRKRLESNGWRSRAMTREEAERFVRSEAERWPTFLRQAGVKAE